MRTGRVRTLGVGTGSVGALSMGTLRGLFDRLRGTIGTGGGLGDDGLS